MFFETGVSSLKEIILLLLWRRFIKGEPYKMFCKGSIEIDTKFRVGEEQETSTNKN